MKADIRTGSEIESKLFDIIRKNMEQGSAVTLTSKLKDELGVDSFGSIMIINAIEDDFNITVDEADFENIITVADILSTLKTKYLK